LNIEENLRCRLAPLRRDFQLFHCLVLHREVRGITAVLSLGIEFVWTVFVGAAQSPLTLPAIRNRPQQQEAAAAHGTDTRQQKRSDLEIAEREAPCKPGGCGQDHQDDTEQPDQLPASTH